MFEGQLARETPHHRLSAQLQLGPLQLRVAAEFRAPWTVLFGPSGSGKSTLLRLMAGTLPSRHQASLSSAALLFSRDDNGWVTLAEGEQGLFPESRAIAYAPQRPSLFPHLTVAENVRFALNASAQPAVATAARLVDEARELLELEPLWHRRPAELSGGEQQRVNLARAYARPGARLLLLDEPFAGLDRTLRGRVVARLRPALASRGLPVISVTHDVEEAFLLQADVLRLEAGQVVAQAPVGEVLAAERDSLRSVLQG